MKRLPSEEEFLKFTEEKKMRYLKYIVDLTSATLKQQRMSKQEAEQLIEACKKNVLKLFPDKEDTFELIYRPRFNRIVEERFRGRPH